MFIINNKEEKSPRIKKEDIFLFQSIGVDRETHYCIILRLKGYIKEWFQNKNSNFVVSFTTLWNLLKIFVRLSR